MQDTRNKHDPRLRDTPPTMAMYSRRERRDTFNASMRDTVPEVDEDPWDPGHEIEDVILARLDEDAFGETWAQKSPHLENKKSRPKRK